MAAALTPGSEVARTSCTAKTQEENVQDAHITSTSTAHVANQDALKAIEWHTKKSNTFQNKVYGVHTCTYEKLFTYLSVLPIWSVAALRIKLLACYLMCPANSSAPEIWVHEGWHSCAMRAPVISGFVVLRPARSTSPVSCCSSSRALSRAPTSHWFRHVRPCRVLGAVALQLTQIQRVLRFHQVLQAALIKCCCGSSTVSLWIACLCSLCSTCLFGLADSCTVAPSNFQLSTYCSCLSFGARCRPVCFSMLSVAAVIMVIESISCGRSLHPVVPVPDVSVHDRRWSAVVPLVPTCICRLLTSLLGASPQSLALCSTSCARSLPSADHRGIRVEFRQSSTTSIHVHVFGRTPLGGGSVGHLSCRQHQTDVPNGVTVGVPNLTRSDCGLEFPSSSVHAVQHD